MDVRNCWKKRISLMLNVIDGGVGPGDGKGEEGPVETAAVAAAVDAGAKRSRAFDET